MFRNNYDNDSVTFSPQGRIFQVEYAQEAVKQGSVVVGIVSKTHAVLAAIKVCAFGEALDYVYIKSRRDSFLRLFGYLYQNALLNSLV